MTHSNVMARPVWAIALNIVLMQMARSGRANDGGGAAEESIPPPIGISAGSSTSPPRAMANRPRSGDADDVTSEVLVFRC
jgi:hypothetical protein